MKKCKIYLTEYRTPKKALAEIIGIPEVALYQYLNPQKYASYRPVSKSVLERIAKFERVSVKKLSAEYESRRAA